MLLSDVTSPFVPRQTFTSTEYLKIFELRPCVTPLESVASTLLFSIGYKPSWNQPLAHSLKNGGGVLLFFPKWNAPTRHPLHLCDTLLPALPNFGGSSMNRWLFSLFSLLLAASASLAADSYQVVAEHGVKVTMRDGIVLRADVY